MQFGCCEGYGSEDADDPFQLRVSFRSFRHFHISAAKNDGDLPLPPVEKRQLPPAWRPTKRSDMLVEG